MLTILCDIRNVIDTMQSIWLEEAHVSGSLAEDSTLLGLTFGGYLRSKVCLHKADPLIFEFFYVNFGLTLNLIWWLPMAVPD